LQQHNSDVVGSTVFYLKFNIGLCGEKVLKIGKALLELPIMS